MFRRYKTLVLMMSFCSIIASYGQQEPQFTQYMHNAISVNPAYAGSRDMLSAGLVHRTQWVGIDGAPTSQTLFIHSPIPYRNLGVGVSMVNDKIGATSRTWVNADFSYRIKLNQQSELSLGLKGGLTSSRALLSDLYVTETGDITQFDYKSGLRPNFGFGVYYSSETTYLGFAVPKLLNNRYITSQDVERYHYFFIAGHVFDLSQGVKLKGSILTKVVEGAPLSLDLSANFLFQEKWWVGCAYRVNESVSLLTAFQLSNQWLLGYSYDYSIAGFRSINGGSHELMLTYDLNVSKRRVLSPRYF